MATQSLYRRYRPRRFSEVKGQDHVVRALRNAVIKGREGQAYLFSGPRGHRQDHLVPGFSPRCSTASNPLDGEPCCECESCLAVERGTSYDVHELDAASNNGVEAMRDLIEKASLGTPGRHKVYILDEVHMLSKGAEAALLKTLEEPPPHVVFVLATTDPQKMSATRSAAAPSTCSSICCRRPSCEEHVRWVAADAGLDVTDAALEPVLRAGGGSARDTLSALELVASTGGTASTSSPLDEFVEAFDRRDPDVRSPWSRTRAQGRDARTLTEDLIAPPPQRLPVLMAPELVQLPEPPRRPGRRSGATPGRAPASCAPSSVWATMLVEMRHAPDPRVLLDVATVQLTADSVSLDVSSLLDAARSAGASGGRRRRRAPATAAPAAPVDPSTGRVASVVAPGTAARTPAALPPSDGADRAEVDPASPSRRRSPRRPQATGATTITDDDWTNADPPSLRGMPRAIYASAEFVRSTDSTLTLRGAEPGASRQVRGASRRRGGRLERVRGRPDHVGTRRRRRRRAAAAIASVPTSSHGRDAASPSSAPMADDAVDGARRARPSPRALAELRRR